MSYEIIGKLVAKFDIVQRTETFKTREFVIEKTDDINGRTITNYVKFQCVQDKTAMPDRFNLNDEVKVLFNIKGTNGIKTVKTIISLTWMPGEWKPLSCLEMEICLLLLITTISLLLQM